MRRGYYHKRNYHKSSENIYQYQEGDEIWDNVPTENTVRDRFVGGNTGNNPSFETNPVNYSNHRGRGRYGNNVLPSYVEPNDDPNDSDNDSVSSSNSSNSRSQRFPYRGNVRQNYSNRGMGLLPTSYQSEDLQSFKRGGYSKPANKNNYRGRGKYKPQYQQPASFNREAGDYSLGDKSQNYPQNFVDNANQFKLQANKSFPPSDTSSFSCNDKIALMANFKNFLQNVNPSELVKDYRQRINKLEENCLSKHEKRFKKITSANDIASNKEKIIFQKHLDIIKQQQRTFEQCVTKIKGQLTDIYGLPSSSVYTKCEEIFDEVKCECKMFKKSLPVYAYKSEILSSVAQNQVTIVSVDACYSANEMIPLFICQAYPNDNILSCQPDAGSSIFLAKTCGILAGGDLMNSVGYKTEVIEAIAKDAKIVFISALKLYQDSIKDPNFLNYKTLILHCDLKRSVEVDFLFERLRCCLLERLDFKVILLLSPVKDISTFVSYFSSVTVNTIVMPDIIFPVQTVWKNSSVSFDGDYVNEVIETALAIQALNEQGDVLIFLPTFSDVNKVLKILSVRLIEYQYYDARCISLHKDLSDPSNLSFLKNDGDNSKRRFFLSTSWAELLSLPSVAYIIDTGVQKHLQYDQQRASDLLKQTLISKTRAKLRKYYAGRFSTGICYRLYSKHDYLKKMPPDDVPEVLCKNPLEIMIKLFQYNPTNAMKIEFIENISKEVKEKTLVMLKNANAIKEGKLTTLGGQIVKLPFLPRYSKLIVIGIQWGFPLEAVMLVAYFLVNEPIFIYDTDDKEMQRKVEATKLRYVSFDSDTLTFLNIYKKWMLNDCQESWCIDRALNFNVLMNVQEKIKDIIITVSMNLKENISTDIRLEQEPQYLEIQEMVFDCFKDNLCVYTGHSRSGYHFLRGEGITFLHQSSSVIQRSNPPEYVVFDHLEMKSRPFMMGVTAVPKDIITSATKKGTFKFDETNLLKRKLEPITVENVGVILIRHVLLGKKGRKLMEIEDSIKKETKCDLIVIEPSEEKGNVTIFAPTECAKKAEMMIQDVLRTKLETILNEEETSILQLKKGQVEVPVHITWKKGGLIIHIKPEIHGAKPKVKTIKGETDNEESCMKQCINLRWIRRLCKGFGFLSFAKEDFAFARRLSMTSVIVNDKEADVAINKIKANQLYISGLSDDTSEEDFKLAFNAVLKERFSCDVKIENGHLIFHKPFETTEEELQRLQEHIFDGVYKLLGINDFTVSIPKPKDIDSVNKASITINDPGILEQSAHLLDDCLTIYGYAVKAEPVYYATIICSNDVFFALKEQMDSELFQLRNRLRHELSSSNEDEVFKFNVESKNNGFACLKLSSGQEKVINILQRMVNKWLEGKMITSDNFRKLHKLFTHGGHLWLKTIEHQENVHIIDEYKSKSIRIYGNMQKCDAVVERIRKYLQNTEEEMVKKIDLSRGKHSRTLLKAVLLKYGVDLKNFVQDFELRSAEVNIRKAQLVLHGDPDSVEKAMAGLEGLASSCSPDVEEELASSQELCCTCIMPPLQSSIRLEHCGHLYCVECLKGLITNAKFPILCSAEKCEKELILEDIRRGLDYDDNEINHLLDLSMTDFIMQHKEDFTYCPAPDCSMFFNKKEIVGTKWRCTLCQNDICVKCNVVFHHGYTCEMYQGTKDDPNYSVKLWLTNTKANCKPCPKCKTGIEKITGCNHMTCSTCHAHFCWLCVTAFPDAGSTYDHLPYCRKIQAPYV